jgi:hypothetical protein
MELDMSKETASKLLDLAFESLGVHANIVRVLKQTMNEEPRRALMRELAPCYDRMENLINRIYSKYPELKDMKKEK